MKMMVSLLLALGLSACATVSNAPPAAGGSGYGGAPITSPAPVKVGAVAPIAPRDPMPVQAPTVNPRGPGPDPAPNM